jgi:pimeloyl-ACP methyl ester carboxylesterase
MRCATLEVPLDYQRPSGRKIEITVSRLPSQHPQKRRGVLLVNPGGPGIPGLGATALLGFPQSVLDSYDLIGFDPRGIGHSTPVTCDLTPEQRALGLNVPYPLNAADVAKQAETAKAEAKQCATSATATVMPYVTTANTARDMDQIRGALGEPKISYYGESYGTYLGAVYASLFPDHGDRVVLDSSLPPEGYDIGALRSQAMGFQTRFPDFATYAAANDDEFGLGSTPLQVTAKYYQIAARLDKTPTADYDGTTFRAVTAFYLRDDRTLPALAALFRDLGTKKSKAAPPAVTSDNSAASYYSVICNDSRWPRSVQTYQRNVAIDRLRYPMYGASTANIRPCAFWLAPVQPKVSITGRGPSNVLILQNLRDPATPLPGALRMRSAFGARARIVTVDQGGHVAYGAANKCGNAAVTDYLVAGDFPARDTFCAAQPA